MAQGPYGLGFGLGQAGAGLATGLTQGLALGPQVEQARLQNQMTKMQLGQRQAEAEALQKPVGAADDTLTPFEAPLAQISHLENAAKAGGDVRAATELMHQKVQLQHQRTSHLLGMGAKAALGGGTQDAMKYLNAAGLGIEGLTRNPDETYNIKFAGQPEQRVPKEFILQVASNPEQMLNQLYQQNYHQGLLGAKAAELELKKQKATKYAELQDRKLNQALTEGAAKRASSERVAQIGASGRIGQASITQKGATERFKMAPKNQLFGYLTGDEEEGGLGMKPDAAMAQLKSYDQRKPGETSEMWAYKQAVRTASSTGRGEDEDYIGKLQQVFMNALPSDEAPAAPGAPAPKSPKPAKAAKVTAPVASKKDTDGNIWDLINGQWVKRSK